MATRFKKGDKVVYPKHGAGKVIKVYDEVFAGVTQKYYKIGFIKSPTTVSIPVEKAEELGLRAPLTRKELLNTLKIYNTQVNISRKTLMTLDAVSKLKLISGKIEDVIDLVNLLRSLAKQKEEENKNFSYSYSDRLEIAMEFIESEVEMVLGKSALKKLEIKEDQE